MNENEQQAQQDEAVAKEDGAAAPPYQMLPEHVVAETLPKGYIPVHGLKYLDGRLHQLHESEHGQRPKNVWVPVGGVSLPPGFLADIERMMDVKITASLDRSNLPKA